MVAFNGHFKSFFKRKLLEPWQRKQRRLSDNFDPLVNRRNRIALGARAKELKREPDRWAPELGAWFVPLRRTSESGAVREGEFDPILT